MPNLPLSELTSRQLLWYIATNLKEELMSALTDALGRLGEEVSQQLQQTQDALADVQAALEALTVSEAEKAALQAALDEATASVENAVTAVNAQSDALAADDPAPEPEPEPTPEPEEPTPTP